MSNEHNIRLICVSYAGADFCFSSPWTLYSDTFLIMNREIFRQIISLIQYTICFIICEYYTFYNLEIRLIIIIDHSVYYVDILYLQVPKLNYSKLLPIEFKKKYIFYLISLFIVH